MDAETKRIRRSLGALAGKGGPEGRKALLALRRMSGDPEPKRVDTIALEQSVSRLEADRPVARMLASRPDLAPGVVAQLSKCPLAVVSDYLRAHPAESEDLSRRMMDAAVAGISGRRPPAPHTREGLAKRMGIAPPGPEVTNDVATQSFHARGVESRGTVVPPKVTP